MQHSALGSSDVGFRDFEFQVSGLERGVDHDQAQDLFDREPPHLHLQIWGLEFRVQGSAFRVWGVSFRVHALVNIVKGAGVGVYPGQALINPQPETTNWAGSAHADVVVGFVRERLGVRAWIARGGACYQRCHFLFGHHFGEPRLFPDPKLTDSFREPRM